MTRPDAGCGKIGGYSLLPTYRFVLFWFRLCGFLAVLNDPPQWRMAPPWQEAAKHGNRLMTQTYVFLCQVGATLTTRPVAILAGVIGVLALLAGGLGPK